MTKDDFEKILDTACETLTRQCQAGPKFDTPLEFEVRVREVLDDLLDEDKL